MALSYLLQRLYYRSRNCRHHRRTSVFSVFLSHPKKISSFTADQPESKPSSLSARMSFVFDQIDAIEKERSQKDETLQRIRAWRESKRTNKENTTVAADVDPGSDSTELDSGDSEVAQNKREESVGLMEKKLELVHPWPEWIEFMERLVQQNYFDHRRKDEDKMIQKLGFDMSEVAEEGFDFTRDWRTVQTAVLNFGRDRFDILRSLSRQDIQVLVGHGCPSEDKKVVFSAKLLRKRVHLDEGEVCSSCSLRSSCERAYLLTNKEDEARTLDVVRVLLAYGFDPITATVTNKSLLKMKSVKTVVRKLLHEVVKLSAVPIDPNLPPPVIKKPPPKVKQPPPPPKKRVGRDDIEMKKGDWLCPKCDFMNFAKNTICLQCDANRPKRQLLPGEWECPQCNFLNYRRNMVCFHCEHKRPQDEYMENQMQDRQRGPRTRPEKVSDRAEISNAWNFDFDDNESDGADVAAFEYADSRKMNDDYPLERPTQVENQRSFEQSQVREYSNHGPKYHATGFDDFEEEEDDDVDSYELDTQNNNRVQKNDTINFSELEADSKSEGTGKNGDDFGSRQRAKQPKPVHKKTAFSSEEDECGFGTDDDDLPVHPNWKSSHVADSRQRSRKTRSFGSDQDLELSSSSEDFTDDDVGSRKNARNTRGGGRDFVKRGGRDFENRSFSDVDSDDDDDRSFRGNRSRGGSSRGRKFENSKFRSNNINGDRRNSFEDSFSRPSRGRGGRGNGHGGLRGNDYDRERLDGRDDGFQNFRSRRPGKSSNQQVGRSNNYGNRSDNYFDDDRPRRPRVNVR